MEILVSPWELRIRRAAELAERYSEAREALRFYGQLTGFQQDLIEALRASVETGAAADRIDLLLHPLREDHRSLLLRRFPEFLSLIQQVGPRVLAETAAALDRSATHWPALLDTYWTRRLQDMPDPEAPDPLDFFAKAFLQPYAALLSGGATAGAANGDSPVRQGLGRCPLCRAWAQVSVLRPEGYGAARSLMCSLCGHEWRFKRVRCPACGEEAFERLVVHRAQEVPHVRIGACESCMTYLKEVDLTQDGLAVPLVDEIATVSLDLVATERGYRKLELNLIGI